MINTQLKHQTKFITREEISSGGDAKKFSITIYYDLSNETEDDELREVIECDIDVIRELLYKKFKEIPRGEQYNNKMDRIVELIENC
ncbi:MAG: hypothetical protein LBS84_06900 [Clostridiales bacterium]|jgi:hypothetical protein|nr:hypothetical protein [Clostridiales bacterium]